MAWLAGLIGLAAQVPSLLATLDLRRHRTHFRRACRGSLQRRRKTRRRHPHGIRWLGLAGNSYI